MNKAVNNIRMLALDMITQSEYDEATRDSEIAYTDSTKSQIKDGVYARIANAERIKSEKSSFHSYFVDELIKEVSLDLHTKLNIPLADANYRLYNSGLKIYATIDTEMQDIMDAAFMNDKFFPASDFKIDVQYLISIRNTITGKVSNIPPKRFSVKKEEEIDAKIESIKNELLGVNDEVAAERVIPIPQPQAAMIIMDYYTGHVKAVTGGRGDKLANRAFNRATDSERHPGSVFKVLASYAPSIDLGLISPATVIVDEPLRIGDKDINNWWGKTYRGPQTVRIGIRDSMNILAVKNLMSTGIDNAFDYLINFGFTTLVDRKNVDGQIKTDRVPSLALGGITYGVTQKELTAAMGAIANQGIYTKPVFYTKVLDRNNTTILESVPEKRQVLKKTSAYLLTDMMKDVVTSGTGGKARFTKKKMPISGKTGTSTDTRDLTFVGFTPYYAAGIWMGFDTPEVIKEDKGYHLLLWSNIMEQIHENLPTKEFERPDGITSGSVCNKSGKLPIEGLCSVDGSVISDIFAVGMKPTEYCTYHTVDMLYPTESELPGENSEIYMPNQPTVDEPSTNVNQDFSITPPPMHTPATFSSPPSTPMPSTPTPQPTPIPTPEPTLPPEVPEYTGSTNRQTQSGISETQNTLDRFTY